MIAIPICWYAGQLVYSRDVIETNKSFHFLEIGEKVPSRFVANRGCLVEQVIQSKHQDQ